MTAGAGTAGGEFGRLARVVVHPVAAAFRNQETIAREWRALNFTSPPDFDRARGEYARFLEVIASSGAEILELPAHPVLVLEGDRERLVPLVKERLAGVDLGARRLTLDWHPDD